MGLEGDGYTVEDVCGGSHNELVWSPYGEGVCTCKENFYADSNGTCHEVGSLGSCSEGMTWGIINGTLGCITTHKNDIRDTFKHPN